MGWSFVAFKRFVKGSQIKIGFIFVTRAVLKVYLYSDAAWFTTARGEMRPAPRSESPGAKYLEIYTIRNMF